MKAMIFAAGLGTRLKPLTDNMPKALVPVAGMPMLRRVVERLKSAGYTEIVINVHHLAYQIIDYLRSNNNFNVDIKISDETNELLDTGGGILHASHLLGKEESVLVHNVDILSNSNLEELHSYHETSHKNAHATMLVSDRNSSRKLLFDNDNRLCGWINKNSGQTKPQKLQYAEGKYKEYAFSGIQIINPSIFTLMRKYNYKGKFSIIDFYMDMLQHSELNVYGYNDNNLSLLDIGKPEILIEAEKFVETIK